VGYDLPVLADFLGDCNRGASKKVSMSVFSHREDGWEHDRMGKVLVVVGISIGWGGIYIDNRTQIMMGKSKKILPNFKKQLKKRCSRKICKEETRYSVSPPRIKLGTSNRKKISGNRWPPSRSRCRNPNLRECVPQEKSTGEARNSSFPSWGRGTLISKNYFSKGMDRACDRRSPK